MARASGCSLAPSTAAARTSTCSPPSPFSDTTSVTRGVPVVSVPVLSKAIARSDPACSRQAPPLISTPRRVAAPSAARKLTGVEITSAQGQEMMSRARPR